MPKAGSAYIYSFVTVGEFVAFLIGWNLILEYAIGAASVSKGISNYVDSLAGGRISSSLMDVFPMHVAFFGKYADFFALGIIFFLSGRSWYEYFSQTFHLKITSMITYHLIRIACMAFGAKESVLINNVCKYNKIVGLQQVLMMTKLID